MIATIFTRTNDGIIKSYIDYNPLYNKIQVYIDGTVYAQFNTDEYIKAREYLQNSFLPESLIHPDIQLVTDDRPLEIQLKELTGEPLTTSHYDYLCGLFLLRHIKTGLIIQIVKKESLISSVSALLKVYKDKSADKRSPETIELNKKLEIVKIDSDYQFSISDAETTRANIGYCFYIEGKGYITFKDDKTPYTPIGGINSLEEILKSGGFLSYDGIEFLVPANKKGISKVCKDDSTKPKIIEFTLSLNNHLKADWIKHAYLVKHKRKVKAKINEYVNGQFCLEMNGLSWFNDNLEQCKRQIINNYSSFLDAIDKPAEIKIINATGIHIYTHFSIEYRDKEDGKIWFFHIIRENEEDAKSQLSTYPPKENDIINIKTYSIDIVFLNSTGLTCMERGIFSDTMFLELMHKED